MKAFTKTQEEAVKKMITDSLDERVNHIVAALNLDYDPEPLLNGFKIEVRGWDAYNAVCLLRASILAYRNEEYILRELKRVSENVRFFENKKTHTQAFAISIDGAIVVAFRGTETSVFANLIGDLLTDVNIKTTDFKIGKVHSGFLKSLNSVWNEIASFIQENNDGEKKIWFCGHSLGGALATLAAAQFVFESDNANEQVGGLFTIGQPRTGNKDFVEEFNKRMGNRTVRIAKNNDPVTMLPFGMGYRHINGLRYIQRDGTYRHISTKDGRIMDRLIGFLGVASITFFKIVIARFLFIRFEHQSIAADHNASSYLASIRDVRNRKEAKAEQTTKPQKITPKGKRKVA